MTQSQMLSIMAMKWREIQDEEARIFEKKRWSEENMLGEIEDGDSKV